MKVGILTFQFADNYGAVLQCFALQEACKKYTADVNVIDYVPRKMIGLKSKMKRLVLKTELQKRFDQFRDTNFQKMSVKDSCDVILVGSDQVWNSNINDYDEFWILPKMKYKRLCSYAASFGKETISHREAEYLKQQKKNLMKYSYITVREQAGQRFLREIGISSEIVCDPTLLFMDYPEFYDVLAKKSQFFIDEKYILVYSLERSEEMERLIKELRKKKGYKVLLLHPMNAQLQDCDIFINDASVYDFLRLIKGADYVITNSFHGLAFSYIFRKKVYSINHSVLSARQEELLNKSGFQYQVYSKNIYYIDTEQNTEEMQRFVDNSKKILRKMISE